MREVREPFATASHRVFAHRVRSYGTGMPSKEGTLCAIATDTHTMKGASAPFAQYPPRRRRDQRTLNNTGAHVPLTYDSSRCRCMRSIVSTRRASAQSTRVNMSSAVLRLRREASLSRHLRKSS